MATLATTMNMTTHTAVSDAPSQNIQYVTEVGTLDKRLKGLHQRLCASVPEVDRIACALYDPAQDTLKTFINSTLHGEPIVAYEYKLSESKSLSELAKTGAFRVIDDIPAVIPPNAPHSSWVLSQGYRSSFTVPMTDNGQFLGFIFFDSRQKGAFEARHHTFLLLYATLINMTISNGLAAVRSIEATARVARGFADLRDFETGAHLERMARYSRTIARILAPEHHLPDEYVEHIQLFAPLHDIGKIGIPDRILLKPGALSPEERAEMETHVAKGVAIVARIVGDFGLTHMPDSQVMYNIVAFHHEFLDGSGYPNGLRGKDIPLEARIVVVADIFDALTSRRPYKVAWTPEESCMELQRMALDGKLDSECVAAVVNNLPEFLSIRTMFQDRFEPTSAHH